MKHIWIVGAGTMAQDYIKVLKALDCNFTVIGRSHESAMKCEKVSNCQVITGGLDNFLKQNPQKPTHVIVSVGVEKLFESTKELLNYGVTNILVEKPAGLHKEEFKILTKLTHEKNAHVYVAYNRRFYASVMKAQEIIVADGGVSSFNFEFTEWGHVIAPLKKADGVKEKWFLGNSTHVVDLAFYLGGKPKELCTFTQGSLEWHPSSAVFSGAGISTKDALFSYQANWKSAGRWSVEILTNEHRLILCPMEKLKIQKRGSIVQDLDENIDYTLDDLYKPGLYVQVNNFLNNITSNFCDIEEQYQIQNTYARIANYKK